MKSFFQKVVAGVATMILAEVIFASAQLTLKPSIGLLTPPHDQDSICPLVFNIDTAYRYESTGLHDGDTIPEFILYTVNDEQVNIAEILKAGNPVLMIGGSYTCPVFRQKRERINQLQAMYGDRIKIFVVYTEEAHPRGPDLSPNSGTVWTHEANIKKNILYPQPKTYGDRRRTAKDMLAVRDLRVPLLLDGPCNSWWTTFGIAPNSAFLIAPTGILFHKQGWLNSGDAPMSFYIDSLLNSLDPSTVHSQLNVRLDQTADSVIRFLFDKELVDATLSIYDQYGRDPYGTITFSGKEYGLDATRFSPGTFVCEIRNGKEVSINHFTITKKKIMTAKDPASR